MKRSYFINVRRAIVRRAWQLAAVSALVFTCSTAFAAFVMMMNGIYYGLDFAGLEGWPRLVLLFSACFTVGLDVSLWVGLNLTVLFNKTHVFDILPGCTAGEIRFHLLPQSVLLKVWKECRQK